jgi:GR25 family glycosyltransferase involved in LPS biosynthesis
MNQIYKLVDQIYCINLISRPDRYANMKAFEKDSGLKINFFRPERDLSGGVFGCFKSHIYIILQAYKLGYNKVLVFEDDIIKTKSYDSINYNEIIQFINTNNSWEILQLSWFNVFNSLFVPKSSKYTNLSQGGTFLTSSYIINRKGMERILETYKNYLGIEPVDVYYKKIFNLTMWNIVPMPFDQNRYITNDNILFNKTIDKILMCINMKLNSVYNLSLFKYYNGCFIVYAIIVFLIIKNFFNKQLNH